MNVDSPIPDFLANSRDDAPAELQHLFLDFEDLWERKLWHQLTDRLVEFFNHKDSAPQRLAFYKTFILTFADKINQLKLVTLALSAASQCKGRAFEQRLGASAHTFYRQRGAPFVPDSSRKQSKQPKFARCICLRHGRAGHSEVGAEGLGGCEEGFG